MRQRLLINIYIELNIFSVTNNAIVPFKAVVLAEIEQYKFFTSNI